VTISNESASVTIDSCGLFQLSRSLIRLCTYPTMYGMEATETAWDTDFDMRSTFHDGQLELLFRGAHATVFRVAIDQALRAVGKFNRDLLNELWVKCPSLRDEGTLLVRMPDAFALAHTH
jgi:hypothetical protein